MGIDNVKLTAAQQHAQNAQKAQDAQQAQTEQGNSQQTVQTTQTVPMVQQKEKDVLKESEQLPQGYGIEKTGDNVHPVRDPQVYTDMVNEQEADKNVFPARDAEAYTDLQKVDKVKAEVQTKPENTQENKPQAQQKNYYDTTVYKAGNTEFETVLPKARTLIDEESRQKVYNETVAGYKEMREKGDLNLTDNQIAEQAKLYVQNQENKEKFEATRTFIDKKEFLAAEEARRVSRDNLVKKYTSEGLTQEQAAKRADSELIENKYASWSARRFINRNKDLFFENGKFSDKKLKEYVLKQANNGSFKDESGDLLESKNYRYSLRERRETHAHCKTEDRKTTVHQQGALAKSAGMDTEYNHTWLIRAGVATAAVGAGILGGKALGDVALASKSKSDSVSVAIAKGAAAGAFGSGYGASGVRIAGELVGGTAGAFAGAIAAPLLKDPGEKIKHITEVRKYTSPEPGAQIQPAQEPPLPAVPEPENVPQIDIQPEEPCTTRYVVPNGYSIEQISKETGVPVTKIMEMNKNRIYRFFRNVKNCDTGTRVNGFRAGQMIELPCDANVKERSSKTEQEKYKRGLRIPEICDEKLNSVADRSFWSKHK